LENWQKKCAKMGLEIQDTTIYTMLFADDQLLIAQDYVDLEYKTKKLIDEYELWGLKLNVKKTKYMAIGDTSRDLQLEDGKGISHVNEYNYLGVRITKDGNHKPEIDDRIKRGRAAITKRNSILWDRDVTPKTKTHIYRAIVESTITYAAEIWCLKAKTVAKLNSTEMDFWCQSARISRKDKIRNTIIKQKINVTRSLLDDIKTKQLTWYGHVQRMEEGRLPKKSYEMEPTRKKKTKKT